MPTNNRGSRQEGGKNQGCPLEELSRLTLTLVGEDDTDALSVAAVRTVRKTSRARTSGSVSSESSRRSSTWEESYVFASLTVSFSTRRLGGDIHSKLQDGFEDDLANLAQSAGLAVKSLVSTTSRAAASGARSIIRQSDGHGYGRRLLSMDEMLNIGRYLAAKVRPAVEVPAVLINKLLKVIRIRDKDIAWHENFKRGSRDKSHKVFLKRLDELADLLIEARARWKREKAE
ncbi:hypothetical protein DV736_g1657, partial [Chaetothyriales sp. CBS 134916]